MELIIGVLALLTAWVVLGLLIAVWFHHQKKGHHASPVDSPRVRGNE